MIIHRTPRALRRFFRSPKGYLLLALTALITVASTVEGAARIAPGILGAVAAAALADIAIARWRRGIWLVPDGAVLTGLIVAMILDPAEPLHVPILTAAIAVASKYVFHSRWSNVFNPAALGLVAAYFVFGSAQSWWGALPDLPAAAILILLGIGVLVARHVNKLPMAITFLGVYFGLFTLTAFVGDPARVAEIFRAPDVHAALFFAFFMLDDPPTSPVRYVDQVTFGLIGAVASYAVFISLGAVYFLLAGALIANAWETLRRIEELSRGRATAT